MGNTMGINPSKQKSTVKPAKVKKERVLVVKDNPHLIAGCSEDPTKIQFSG
jgi:hypothetical protein